MPDIVQNRTDNTDFRNEFLYAKFYKNIFAQKAQNAAAKAVRNKHRLCCKDRSEQDSRNQNHKSFARGEINQCKKSYYVREPELDPRNGNNARNLSLDCEYNEGGGTEHRTQSEPPCGV